MKLFDMFKKKEEKVLERIIPDIKKATAALAIAEHKKRISNLNEEFDMLTTKLRDVSLNTELTKNERVKQTDSIIRRITIIKYEIGIREGLIEWLT